MVIIVYASYADCRLVASRIGTTASAAMTEVVRWAASFSFSVVSGRPLLTNGR